MKKYYGELKGKKIVLSEANWEQLRKRYDVERVVHMDNEYRINIDCPLCYDYLVHGCRGCTFNKFEKNGSTSEGCTNVMEIVLGTEDLPFHLSCSQISWSKVMNKEAEEALNVVYRRLGEMRVCV